MAESIPSTPRERAVSAWSGWLMLPIQLVWLLSAVGLIIVSIVAGLREVDRPYWVWLNLMVVLCGDAEVHPVINTGTLYA